MSVKEWRFIIDIRIRKHILKQVLDLNNRTFKIIYVKEREKNA